jgi:hypothetical protein
MELLDGALLFAVLLGFRPQPGRQPVGKSIKLAGRSGTLNFGSTPSDRRYLRMVFRDSPCAGQSPGSIDVSKMPASDNAQ